MTAKFGLLNGKEGDKKIISQGKKICGKKKTSTVRYKWSE